MYGLAREAYWLVPESGKKEVPVRNDHLVIDADGHVIEPHDLWDRYLDPQFQGIRPTCDPNSTSIEVLGKRMPRSYRSDQYRQHLTELWDTKYAVPKAKGYNAASHIESMDEEGIDAMVLFPSRGLFAAAIGDMDGRIASALCNAYNRWLADFCSYNPKRLFGVALVSLHAPELAVLDARAAVSGLGMRGVVVRPNPYAGRNLHDPAYDEILLHPRRSRRSAVYPRRKRVIYASVRCGSVHRADRMARDVPSHGADGCGGEPDCGRRVRAPSPTESGHP